jgi:hypothetical protein
MQGVDVFCERCGTPQPKPEVAAPRSAGVLARRMLDAVGITENQPTPTEDWLRLCLSCRGYSCPTCWNDAAGACQTCEPLPEPVIEVAAEPMPEPVVIEREPESIPYWVTQLEPLVAARPEPETVNEPDLEPVALVESVEVLDPDPVFVADAPADEEPAELAQPEPEPEPAVAEPEPAVAEPEPAVAEPEAEPEPPAVERPRMPVLPLPPPRPADAPLMPLPTLPDYAPRPQIGFDPQVTVASSAQTSAPAYEAHMLLAPPARELPPNAIAAGLRPCASCQLTLSARAHFCRRCGTAQAV